ncbi:MAG: pyridoxamine 5'-phosphate oxidase family protein [Thermodesulfobacteriota bacterium]|nr:pyridoxamine 5'-phosphate oxidase family protein [Thermodesulfobacteriota bacterium]
MLKKKWDLNTLDRVLNEVWTMLKRGSTHFNDPFHWPVLGTTGEDACSLRTVILRQLILPERIIVCHTDARAPKAKEIHNSSRVSWLFYHPKKKVQLRIAGRAELHTDDQFADDQWAASRITSRLDYCAAEAPGTPVNKPTSGLPDFLLNKIPTLLESKVGRKNFMSVACRIDSIDWLVLRAIGHRRARFVWNRDILNSTWLIP